jgi:hypothetical protein
MGQADLVIEMPAIRSEENLLGSLGVMIEVPETKARQTKGRHRGAQPRTRVVRRQPRLRKRRLRSEVRLAGCALLALIPIVSACTLGWSNHPDRILACSISDPLEAVADGTTSSTASRLGFDYQASQAGAASPASFVLSTEPAITVPGDAEVPVNFPGFVLPDDSREDLSHEGS